MDFRLACARLVLTGQRPRASFHRPTVEAETIDRRSSEGVAPGRAVARRRDEFEPLFRARAAWVAVVLLAAASAAGAAELSVSPVSSRDGVFRVSWSGAAAVVLEEARRADFADAREAYRGTDRATVLTGLRNGTYHFRLFALDGSGPIAADVTAEVEHHPLVRAFAFFAVGLFVFVCTTALVLSEPDPADPEDPSRG